MALAIALIMAAAAPAAAQLTVRTADEARLERLRGQALSALNRDRVGNGLNPLVLDETLSAAAQAHAQDMLERDYFAHDSPEGESVADRYDAAGGSRWRFVGENLASCARCPTPPGRGRVAEFQQGWMNSPGHRENILRAGLTEFGFGMVWERGRIYGVQTFGGPGVPRGARIEGLALGPDALSLRMVEMINRTRDRDGLPLLEGDPALDAAAARLASNDPDRMVEAPYEEQPFDALDPAARNRWEVVRFMATRCGGCGVRPTAADAEAFAGDWGRSGRSPLSDPAATHLGFAIKADGAGMKTAVMVLAGGR